MMVLFSVVLLPCIVVSLMLFSFLFLFLFLFLLLLLLLFLLFVLKRGKKGELSGKINNGVGFRLKVRLKIGKVGKFKTHA